tara:strand:- start:1108 stop:2343 length:1236 start_codon:yes stop_codon:yes gene_type:complete
MFKKENFIPPKKNTLSFYLLVFFPVFLILGNLFINFFYVAFTILALLNLKESQKFYKSYIFYLLILFLVYLTINLFFSINLNNSVPRFIKFFLIIFFIKEFQNLIQNKDLSFEKILYFWTLIFFIVSFDIIFEFIIGFNVLGFYTEMPGRIASFFGDELVVGGFYHFMSLLILAFFINQKFSSPIILILSVLIILISFTIGERANFIKLFLSIFLFLFFIIKTSFFKKVGISSIILVLLSIIVLTNENIKYRYYDQVKIIYSSDGFNKYFKESQYGAHQDTAYKIFINNKFFGVGLKNFREESKREIYKNDEFKKTDTRVATHPHQLHLELLSETGLIGYLTFFLLILYSIYYSMCNYLTNKNIYQFSTILFVFSNLIPLIPSGSIFSTFYGGIFWFNFALMLSFNKYSKS